jgi:hypothetical protein
MILRRSLLRHFVFDNSEQIMTDELVSEKCREGGVYSSPPLTR